MMVFTSITSDLKKMILYREFIGKQYKTTHQSFNIVVDVIFVF